MSGPITVVLLDSTGGAAATATGSPADWPGGQGVFVVVCTTFNGATIKLQFLGPDNATWIDAGAATTLTSSGAGVFNLHPCKIRCSVSAAVPSTGVWAQANRVTS